MRDCPGPAGWRLRARTATAGSWWSPPARPHSPASTTVRPTPASRTPSRYTYTVVRQHSMEISIPFHSEQTNMMQVLQGCGDGWSTQCSRYQMKWIVRYKIIQMECRTSEQSSCFKSNERKRNSEWEWWVWTQLQVILRSRVQIAPFNCLWNPSCDHSLILWRTLSPGVSLPSLIVSLSNVSLCSTAGLSTLQGSSYSEMTSDQWSWPSSYGNSDLKRHSLLTLLINYFSALFQVFRDGETIGNICNASRVLNTFPSFSLFHGILPWKVLYISGENPAGLQLNSVRRLTGCLSSLPLALLSLTASTGPSIKAL